MDLTMRQVAGLLKVINKSDLVEFYNTLLSYNTAMRAQKLPTLGEFLGVASNEAPKVEKGFDEETDKLLEAEALKRLAERQKQYGK